MVQSRKNLEEFIVEECSKILGNKEECCRLYNELKDSYNIPIGMSSDIITLRKEASEYSEFVLFCILSVIGNKSVKDFFTKEEIKVYSKTKYETKKVKLPIVFDNIIQISDDQWIGKITVKQLMLFRDSQMINYNENSQRTMRRIIDGDKEYYKIFVNKLAVSKIRESYEKDLYIPNTITLNIPPDNSEFSYKDNCLTITELVHFDILDGYHRYLAMSQIYDLNDDFDYNMELRVVSFDEMKAQQFIYQEDQKTKMRKIDSDSFNQNNAGNIIAQRLNIDPLCNIQGMINRNNGIIPAGDFAHLVNFFFFRGVPKKKEREKVIETIGFLRDRFNVLTQSNPYFISKRYSTRQLLIVLYIFTKEDIALNELEPTISKVLKNIDRIDSKLFSGEFPRKKLLTEIDSLINER